LKLNISAKLSVRTAQEMRLTVFSNMMLFRRYRIQRMPDDYRLTLLLLSVLPASRILSVFNPFAENQDDDGASISAGIDKLYSTSEQEMITLYEASLIRYFSPEYNKEFKNSFPSTNLKVLQDCYEKDFSTVIAEINHDEIPFRLKSKPWPLSSITWPYMTCTMTVIEKYFLVSQLMLRPIQ
jgi:hypothetical protein